MYRNSKAKDPNITFHRIQKDAERWLEVFDIREEVIKESTHVSTFQMETAAKNQAYPR